MLNIILKNKQLIKLYKYGVWLFKFLNKHFYILSFISLIARFRKGIYYKAISLTIKIIVAINLLITSGLFFTITDFATPLLAIQQFYKDFVGPYLEMINNQLTTIYNKYNDISQLKDKVESDYAKSTIKRISNIDTNLIDNPATNTGSDVRDDDIKDSNKFNVKTLVFYVGVAALVYIFFYLPGGGATPPTPDTIADYNTINRTLIEGKGLLRHLWDVLYNGNTGINPVETVKDIELKPITHKSPDVIIRNLSGGSDAPLTPLSSTGSLTPTASSSQLSPYFKTVPVVEVTDNINTPSALPSKLNACTQTVDAAKPAIQATSTQQIVETVEAEVQTDIYMQVINSYINYFSNYPVADATTQTIDLKDPLLNSTQLLQPNEKD